MCVCLSFSIILQYLTTEIDMIVLVVFTLMVIVWKYFPDGANNIDKLKGRVENRYEPDNYIFVFLLKEVNFIP